MSDWYYKDQPLIEIPKPYKSFVYEITNLTNNKKYIGKKQFYFKKNKKTVESDWKTYYGSNKTLQEDVKELGEENFKRIILHLCSSKSEASYLELHHQITEQAILSKDYYNDWIQIKVTRKHLSKYAQTIQRD